MEDHRLVEAARTIEEFFRPLVPGPHGSISIGFNDGNGYQTVAQRLTSGELDWMEDYWVSEQEKARAIALNSLWCVAWYPAGEVSSYVACASSLIAALAHIQAEHAP